MTTVKSLSLGFSPCPNDTFIFHALVTGMVQARRFSLLPPVLDDVETLNRWAIEGRLDVTKLSFHALGHVLDEYALLSSGSALGRGCGPLLISREELSPADLTGLTIAVPGQFTTAAMLLRMCYPQCREAVVMRFDTIMPALVAGEIDVGVIIHESRFTYPSYGLKLVTDLGSWWEETTGHPIPLGGIAARRSLGREVISALEEAIRQSLDIARTAPASASAYIKSHAQELNDRVIADHIGLYVNDYSMDLGPHGLAAVEEFLRRGTEAGIFPSRPRL